MKLFATIVLLLSSLFAMPASAQSVDHPVNDYAGVLSESDANRIADRIIATRTQTGVQVALLVVTSTDGVPIDDYSLNAARAWGGGTAGANNGVLIVFATRDHHSDIEVGRSVEDRLTDVAVRQILDDARPALRSSRYGDAFTEVTTAVGERVGAHFAGVAARPIKQGMTNSDIFWIIVLVIVAVVVLVWLMRRSSRSGYGGDSFFFFFDGGGSGGSSGSNDSSWGGGGGDFGGGGGSSDW